MTLAFRAMGDGKLFFLGVSLGSVRLASFCFPRGSIGGVIRNGR